MSGKKNRTVGVRKVESFMVTQVHVVTPSMTVREAMTLCLGKKISGAPIVDQNNSVISVVSLSDLMRFAAEGGLSDEIGSKLDKLAKPNEVVGVSRNDTFVDVFKIFLTRRIRRVIVVDATGKLQGIVARDEMLRAFMEEA